MKTNEEVEAILHKAEKEIQMICSQYRLTIDSEGGRVFINHHQKHQSGDWSIRGQSVAFAPF